MTEEKLSVGDWVKQVRSDATAYAMVVDILKNGSYKELSIDDDREVATLTSTKGWFPGPVDSSKSEVPKDLLNKLSKKLSKTKYKSLSI